MGEPVLLLEGVSQLAEGGFPLQFSVSHNGSLVYLPGTETPGFGTPVWRGRDGRDETLTASPLETPRFPALSPQAEQFAITVDGDIWIYDVAGRPPIKLTDGPHFSPLWTMAGQAIVYEAGSGGDASLWAIPADGTNSAPERVSLDGHFHPVAWSPDDGELLATRASGIPLSVNGQARFETDIVRWPIGAPGNLEPVVATLSDEGYWGVALSPNGQWLAYTSDQTGLQEVWVRPYLGPGAAVRVSPSGGTEPVWARNGQELYYLEGDAMVAVAVDFSDGFDFQPPERLFEGNFLRSFQPPSYDVAPDGRFLMIRPDGEGNQTRQRVVVVQNWIEEVKERVPVQ